VQSRGVGMTESELIPVIVSELRGMASAGEGTPSLLRRVQHLLGRKDCALISVQCFHKAFGAGIASISPIGGWCRFGGELTDVEVDSLMTSVLEDYRKWGSTGVNYSADPEQ